jgi:SAM-dependent methyltransferase/uncharacterized protein YbaR (Trm112 family)
LIREEELPLLGCPDCSGAPLRGEGLRVEGGRVAAGALACARCGSSYPIAAGVPWLLPAALLAARDGTGAGLPEDWRLWKERLEGLRAWRESTWDRADETSLQANRRLAESRRDAFAEFCGRISGRVLEVGCGDGYLGRAPGLAGARYWGVDPMPGPGIEYPFPFVAAVGERLPFRDGVFETVMVKESLHHFQDPGRFLDEARRVMARGGALCVCQGVEEPAGARAAARARLLARRAATALRLALRGEVAEMRRRASGGGVAAPAVERDQYVWRLTREGIEREVASRFRVGESRLVEGCLYLRATAREEIA